MRFEPTPKQYIALMKLGAIPKEKIVNGKRETVLDQNGMPMYDVETKELGYGGAAGGGKSVLICRRLKQCCEAYPGTRWFLARNELKRLKTSTLLTFFDILKADGYTRDGGGSKGYKYYDIKGILEFNNGSVIDLIELGYQPSDPLYGRVGSTEYTGGAIDEATEIEFDGYEIIKSRVRYRLEDFCHGCEGPISKENFVRKDRVKNPDFGLDLNIVYTEDMEYTNKNIYLCPHCGRETSGLVGRVVSCFNPEKGWVYNTFRKPFRDGHMIPSRAFIPAIYKDNKHLPESYIQTLMTLSEEKKQRLLYGNFDYDDSPGRLFEYNKILDWFDKKTVSELIEEEFEDNPNLETMIKRVGRTQEFGYKFKMVVDPAREGKDLAVIIILNHLSVEEIVIYGKCSLDILEDKCRELMHKYQLSPRDVLVDEGGVGGGLKDRLRCLGFIAHSRPIQPRSNKRGKEELYSVSYHRLRDQCYHLLSMKQDEVVISLRNVKIYNSELTVEKLKKIIVEDVDAVVQIDIDKDSPYRVISKQDLKKRIGRSPDFGDALMMAMFFELKKPKRVFARG